MSDIVKYIFEDIHGDATLDSISSDLHVEASEVSSYDGNIAFISGNPGFAASENAWNTAVPSNYFGFTVTPEHGYRMSISVVSLDHRRSETGPPDWKIRSSLDGFTSDLVSGSDSLDEVWYSEEASVDIESSEAIEFRIYGLNASSEIGVWRIDNVVLEGSTWLEVSSSSTESTSSESSASTSSTSSISSSSVSSSKSSSLNSSSSSTSSSASFTTSSASTSSWSTEFPTKSSSTSSTSTASSASNSSLSTSTATSRSTNTISSSSSTSSSSPDSSSSSSTSNSSSSRSSFSPSTLSSSTLSSSREMGWRLTSVNVDLTTGEAYLTAWKPEGDSHVIQVNSINTGLTGNMFLPKGTIPRSILVEQTVDGILPFHFEVVSSGLRGSSLPFGFDGRRATDSFDPSQFTPDGGSPDDADPVHSAQTDIFIWYRGDSGVKETRHGVDGTFDSATPSSPGLITRLPIFSWSSTPYSRKASIMVSDTDGGIHLAEYDSESESVSVPISRTAEFLPFSGQTVSGIASDEDETSVFVTTDDYIGIINSDSLEPTSAQRTSEEIAVTSQNPRGRAWGVSTAEGMIFSAEIAEESSSSSESSRSSSSSVSSSSGSSSSTSSSSSASTTSVSTSSVNSSSSDSGSSTSESSKSTSSQSSRSTSSPST